MCPLILDHPNVVLSTKSQYLLMWGPSCISISSCEHFHLFMWSFPYPLIEHPPCDHPLTLMWAPLIEHPLVWTPPHVRTFPLLQRESEEVEVAQIQNMEAVETIASLLQVSPPLTAYSHLHVRTHLQTCMLNVMPPLPTCCRLMSRLFVQHLPHVLHELVGLIPLSLLTVWNRSVYRIVVWSCDYHMICYWCTRRPLQQGTRWLRLCMVLCLTG